MAVLGASDLYTLDAADLSWTAEYEQAGLVIREPGGPSAATAVAEGIRPLLRDVAVASVIAAGRTSKILSRFPAFMLAPSPDKALAAVAVRSGTDMDEAERLGTNIQRAHRLEVADEARDVLGLGALLTLHPADFFILSALYTGGVVGTYDAYVNALRSGVQRAVAILMDGCGTIRALLEGTAILLDADETGEIEHLDDFVHRVAVHHHAGDGPIYLVENPLIEHDSGDVARRCREFFRVTRGGFFDGTVTIQVTGVGNRTVHPRVIDATGHEGVGFDGVVPDGSVLVFTTEGTVLLDGADVSAQAYHFHNALFDYSDLGEDVRGLRAGRDRAPRARRLRLALLGRGGRVRRRDLRRLCVCHIRRHERLAALRQGQAVLGGERAVRRHRADPRRAADAAAADRRRPPSLVRAGLERFRTAGVRLDVRYFDEGWVLDHSVLEDLDSPHGLGVDFDATIPIPEESP